jgi:hypothetical protein
MLFSSEGCHVGERRRGCTTGGPFGCNGLVSENMEEAQTTEQHRALFLPKDSNGVNLQVSGDV